MSAASAIAEKPGRMEKIFLNEGMDKLNKPGIYAINIYALGVPHTVVVDDYLPLRENGDGTYRTQYANVGNDKSMWGALLEKAFSKYHGNYSHTRGGLGEYAVVTMTGGPYERFYHDQGNERVHISIDDLWAQLVEHDGKGDIIQTGTNGGTDT